MHSTHTVRLWADEAYVAPPEVVLFQLVRSREPSDPLRRAIARSRQALLARQQADGSFAEPQLLDPRSLATLVLSTAMLESYQPAQFRSFARGLLEAQQADGGWATDNRGPLDLSATVLAYFALKLSGQMPASEPMVCARRAILSRGGATKIDLPAKLWLAMFGQMPYESLEGIPVLERFLLARITQSLQRKKEELPQFKTAALCQALVAALRPRRHLGSGCGIRELFLATPTGSSTATALLGRFCRARNFLPLRRRAIGEARRSLLMQIETWKTACDQSLTTSATPDILAWALVALDSLGFTADTPARQNTHCVLESLLDIESDTPMLTAPSRLVAARTIAALRASGLDNDHPDIRRGLHWLRGCLPQTTSEAAQRLILLAAPQQIASQTQDLLPPPLQTCVDEFDDEMFDDACEPTEDSGSLTHQILSAQRPDGAWSDSLSQCGRSALAEPANIIATSLAMMALAGGETNTPKAILNRAAAWLIARQQPDGSWAAHGTEGAIAVTSRVLRALIIVNSETAEEAISAAVEWLIAHQQPGGGWGDAEPGQTPAIAGEGPVTPRHTAAALQALLAAGKSGSEAVARGIENLVSTQSRSGDWADLTAASPQDVAAAEGTLLDTVDSLLALGQYAARPRDTEPSQRPMVRLVR